MYWLQSTDVPALAFFLVDPFQYFPGFHIDLTPDDLSRIGTSDPNELLVLSIVTLAGREGGTATANLRAPLLVNLEARQALQSIRPDEGFGVQEALDLHAALATAG